MEGVMMAKELKFYIDAEDVSGPQHTGSVSTYYIVVKNPQPIFERLWEAGFRFISLLGVPMGGRWWTTISSA